VADQRGSKFFQYTHRSDRCDRSSCDLESLFSLVNPGRLRTQETGFFTRIKGIYPVFLEKNPVFSSRVISY